jgi:Uma2 family endonuclease
MSQSPSPTGYTINFRIEQRIPMSYEEFLEHATDIHAEWIDRETIVIGPSSVRHQLVLGFVACLLALYTRPRNLGVVLVAPVAMQFGPGAPFREPDLLFIARKHEDHRRSVGRRGGSDRGSGV